MAQHRMRSVASTRSAFSTVGEPHGESNTVRSNVAGDPARDHQLATGGGLLSYGLVTAAIPVISKNLFLRTLQRNQPDAQEAQA